MTYAEAEKKSLEFKEQGVKCMHFDFKGQEPIELLKIEAFEEEIGESAFHWQKKKTKENGQWVDKHEIVDWKKNFIFLLGTLCGIESMPSESERQGKYSFISKANVYRILPSGNKAFESATYEYDAEIRAEETVLKNEVKYMEYQEKVQAGKKPRYEVEQKYASDAKKRLLVVENAKFGRQKADSGAHKRAIIKMLKIPSPRPEFVGMKVLCYRCVPNMDHREMRQSVLLGNSAANSIFGTPQLEHSEPIDVTENDMEYAYDIRQKADELSEHKALHKLSGIILDKNYNLGEFHTFILNYENFNSHDKAHGIINWLERVGESIPSKQSSLSELGAWIVEWSAK